MNNFLTIDELHGLGWEDAHPDRFPSVLHRWTNEALTLDASGTHYVYVVEGPAILHCQHCRYPLQEGMYASVPEGCRLEGGSGIVITRLGYDGVFSLGGPIEQRGRLRYIDGCTDSLLIPPPRRGDPCLNLLHIPAHTRQSAHTHPSNRVGVIVSGHGECVTPDQSIDLIPGQVFVIPSGAEHSFHTNDSALRVIAYHPETDFGPTDECHPMVNKTILTSS